ncbi:Predicted mechanosensitive ion channel [Ceraceosorus bombacis]|uniref:Predicted mechanosensitive ion channel n=1 Tax=Ceraceosorus bombacis TaxID=401625 RepID=A0A0P1BFN2_9BASI|nr:Predicted mechanosensitive ion channel [Ceraceosorus bombacis]
MASIPRHSLRYEEFAVSDMDTDTLTSRFRLSPSAEAEAEDQAPLKDHNRDDHAARCRATTSALALDEDEFDIEKEKPPWVSGSGQPREAERRQKYYASETYSPNAYPPHPTAQGRHSDREQWSYGGAGNYSPGRAPVHGSKLDVENDAGAKAKIEGGWRFRMPWHGKGYAAPPGDDFKDDSSGSRSDGRLVARLASHLGKIGFTLLITALLWIPGLVALLIYGARPSNGFAQPQVWSVGIFWWSIWLSCSFLATFVCHVVASIVPRFFLSLLGGVQAIKTPAAYLLAVKRYAAAFLWTLFVWIAWLVIIVTHFNDPSQKSVIQQGETAAESNSSDVSSTANLIVTIGRFFFGLALCSAILLVEKFAVQWIAYRFHRVQYEFRISVESQHVDVLAALYAKARPDYPGLTLKAERAYSGDSLGSGAVPELAAFGTASSRVKSQRMRGTGPSASILGTAASSMNPSVMLPFGPRAIVLRSLDSESETRKLAKRIYATFASKSASGDASSIGLEDIADCFPNAHRATQAMELLDADGNGSVTASELEQGCIAIRKERMSLMASMHDVDSAVAALDGVFMSFYMLISLSIIAALLSVKFRTAALSMGAVLLGLSWLIGASAQEALAAILFVFVKHPIDVGDNIEIPGLLAESEKSVTLVVHELQLLSTVFETTTGKLLQVPNAILAMKVIVNFSRSGPIDEQVSITVDYTTELSAIEELRQDMLGWIDSRGRDYRPGLDIHIQDLGDQSKLVLQASIRHKSNWADASLRAERKNIWLCAFRHFMQLRKIYGPSGDPHSVPIRRVAMVDAPKAQTPPLAHAPKKPEEYTLLDSRTQASEAEHAAVADVKGYSTSLSQVPARDQRQRTPRR